MRAGSGFRNTLLKTNQKVYHLFLFDQFIQRKWIYIISSRIKYPGLIRLFFFIFILSSNRQFNFFPPFWVTHLMTWDLFHYCLVTNPVGFSRLSSEASRELWPCQSPAGTASSGHWAHTPQGRLESSSFWDLEKAGKCSHVCPSGTAISPYPIAHFILLHVSSQGTHLKNKKKKEVATFQNSSGNPQPWLLRIKKLTGSNSSSLESDTSTEPTILWESDSLLHSSYILVIGEMSKADQVFSVLRQVHHVTAGWVNACRTNLPWGCELEL